VAGLKRPLVLAGAFASVLAACSSLSPAGRALNEAYPVSGEVLELQRQVLELAPDAGRRAQLLRQQEAWLESRPAPCLAQEDKRVPAAAACMSGADQDRAQSLRRTKFLLMLEAPPQPAPAQLAQVRIAAPLDTGGGGRGMALSPNGARALVVGVRRLLIVDTLTGKTLHRLPIANFENAHLSMFAGGRVAVLTDQHVQGMRFWDAETGELLREFSGGRGPHCILPDGRRIAYAERDQLLIYDPVANRPVSEPASHGNDAIIDVAASPDGKRIATLTYRGTLTLWDVLVSESDGSLILSRAASADSSRERKPARHLVFARAGGSLWTASDIGLVRWSIPELRAAETVAMGDIRGQGLRRIPDTDTLVVAGRQRERGSYLIFYDSTARRAALLEAERHYQPSIEFSADGKLLFTAIVHEIRRRDLPAAGDYAEAEAVLAPLRPAPPESAVMPKSPLLAGLPANLRIEVIGVYEGGGAQTQSVQTSSGLRSARSVTVGIGRTDRPLALVLASYEPVIWDLNAASDAKLVHVLVSGNYESLVRGAGNAQVTRIGQAFTYKFSDPGYGKLQAGIRLYTGRGADGFQGSYRGIRFSVGAGAPDEVARSPQSTRGLRPNVPRVVTSADHQVIERATPRPYGAAAAVSASTFAGQLYQVSAYTSEEQALAVLVDAEIQLLASRWLAAKLSGGAYPTIDWDAQLRKLRKAVEPVAQAYLPKRRRALKEAGLDGREAFMREVERLVASPKDRGQIQFQSGAFVSGGGDQVEDIPEILAFHQRPAAAKWRQLWPELRAHAARLAALHYRIDADPALAAPGRDWDARAAELARRVGGRVLSEQDWRAMTEGRLGYTLSGLDRFPLPLGTEMRPGNAGDEVTTIAERGDAILISRREGRGLMFRFFDARWDREIALRLSPKELEEVDQALTATYSQRKDRWFAPLELEWDAYVSLARQMQASRQMQEVYQSFARDAGAAMERAWAR